MADYHKITLVIHGVRYHIKTQEDPAYVQELAKQLDEAVFALTAKNQSASYNEALVLAAMSSLDSYRKAEQGADHLRGQISEYLEDAAKARLEAAEARREIAKLEAQLAAKGSKRA